MTRAWSIASIALGGVLAVAAAACAGASSSKSVAPAAESSQFARIDARKNELNDLWMQIREWRVDLRFDAEPERSLKMSVWREPVDSIRRVCEMTDPPPACEDVCNLADAICDNAEQICRIADELDGDSWANDKCASAKASCKEAKERCCDCQNDAAEDAAGAEGAASAATESSW